MRMSSIYRLSTTIEIDFLLPQKKWKHIRNKRQRESSDSNSSSSDYEMQKPGPKRFKLVRKLKIFVEIECIF